MNVGTVLSLVRLKPSDAADCNKAPIIAAQRIAKRALGIITKISVGKPLAPLAPFPPMRSGEFFVDHCLSLVSMCTTAPRISTGAGVCMMM